MSFYRKLITAVAAMGLATAVFAADENTQNQGVDANEAAPQAVTQADATAANPAPEATTDATNNNQNQNKVNVNTASAKDLMKVKGLNASRARAIVSYRKKHGEFKSLDELKQVKGFKKLNEKSLQDLQDQLTAG